MSNSKEIKQIKKGDFVTINLTNQNWTPNALDKFENIGAVKLQNNKWFYLFGEVLSVDLRGGVAMVAFNDGSIEIDIDALDA